MIFWLFCCPEDKYQSLSRLIALPGMPLTNEKNKPAIAFSADGDKKTPGKNPGVGENRRIRALNGLRSRSDRVGELPDAKPRPDAF